MKKWLRLVKPGCGDECPERRGCWGKDREIWGMGQGVNTISSHTATVDWHISYTYMQQHDKSKCQSLPYMLKKAFYICCAAGCIYMTHEGVSAARIPPREMKILTFFIFLCQSDLAKGKKVKKTKSYCCLARRKPML